VESPLNCLNFCELINSLILNIQGQEDLVLQLLNLVDYLVSPLLGELVRRWDVNVVEKLVIVLDLRKL